jgi:hypothetical protein
MIALGNRTASGGKALESADGRTGAVVTGDGDVFRWGDSTLSSKLADRLRADQARGEESVQASDQAPQALRGRRTESPEWKAAVEEGRRRHGNRPQARDSIEEVLRAQAGRLRSSADTERIADEVRRAIDRAAMSPESETGTREAERALDRRGSSPETDAKVADAERRLGREAGVARNREHDANAIADGLREVIGGQSTVPSPGSGSQGSQAPTEGDGWRAVAGRSQRERTRPEGELPPAMAPKSIEYFQRMARGTEEERDKIRHAVTRDSRLARLLDQETLRGLRRDA